MGEEKKEGVGRTFLFFSRVYLLIYMVRERGREALVGLRKLPTGCFDGKYNAKKKLQITVHFHSKDILDNPFPS